MEKQELYVHAYDYILKATRTVVDLEGKERLRIGHLAEAINYRTLDQVGWTG